MSRVGDSGAYVGTYVILMQTSVFENIFEGIYIIVRVRASPGAPCVCDRLNLYITVTNTKTLDITTLKAS